MGKEWQGMEDKGWGTRAGSMYGEKREGMRGKRGEERELSPERCAPATLYMRDANTNSAFNNY